mgnify:CR=1 FL=1
MSLENKAVITVKGDFGNPSGSGLSKITLADIWPAQSVDVATKSPDLEAFHTALVTAQLTATAIGTRSLTSKVPVAVAAPGADVNIDRELVVDWQLATSSKIRQTTIPGVPVSSTSLEKIPNGERLNTAGKTAVGAALEAAYGLTAGDIVVLRGKVLQKA